MRWFFLLLVVAGNEALFDSTSFTRVIDGIAFNLFPSSLLLFRFGFF